MYRGGRSFTTREDKHLSHPEAELSTRRPARDPILARVELGYCGYSRNSVTSQLSQLLATASIHICKPVHVANHKFLDTIVRPRLPVWFEYCDPSPRLIVVWDGSCGSHVIAFDAMPSFPTASVGERVDLNGIIVRRRSDMTSS